MTSNEFEEIENAFQEALKLEGDARGAFLEVLERENPKIAHRVRNLLKADATNDTIAEPIAASLESLALETEDPWLEKRIGDWRLTKRIGAGGMGAVFFAERADEQYTQTAALKLMGAQLLDENAATRFRAERQILANLNHPNIAKLIDGGSTEDGLPYLVMEFVDGVRIDEYCDGKSLSLHDRLRLFQKLCTAVDYAHRKLVVHRDLKPSNMLVTEDGEPMLLDFGIAKLLESDEYDVTMAQMGEGARVMTPEYASPEQVRGEPVSVATDVYALGVLLFRLLTGHSPYGPSATTPREIESAILGIDPKKPSASITEYSSYDEKTPTADDLSQMRSLSVERLRTALSGDLDTIILKCLQKESDRRYATARELAADIERYLENRPIHARADSWSYKAKKFLVRNAKPVFATTAVIVAAISLVSFYTLRLADERDKAELAAAEAEEVSSFLINIFREADPHNAQGDPATAIELLQSAEEKIGELDDQPILQSRLVQIIGDTYTNLGELSKAIELLEWSRQVRQASFTEDPISHGRLLQDLAEAYRLSGELEAAERTMRECIIQFEIGLHATHPQVLYLNGRLAVILADQGRKSEALALLQEKLKQRLQQNPQHDRNSLDMYGNTAHMLVDLGRFKEAESTHLEVVRLSKEIDGPLHPNTLIRTYNFALMRMRQYRFAEAEETFDEVIAGAQEVWPKTHANISRWVGTRALVKANLGRFDEAFSDFSGALESLRENQGEASSSYLSRLRYYCTALTMAGRLDEAALALEDAIVLSARNSGEHSVLTNLLRIRLAEVRNHQGRPGEALALLDLAETDNAKLAPRRATDVNAVRAVTFSMLGRHIEARARTEIVIDEKQKSFGTDGAPMSKVYSEAAANLRRAGDNGQAESFARRAHDIGQSRFPTGNWHAALATAEYVYALAASGENDEAKALATGAYDDLIATFGPNDYRVGPLRALINAE